MVDLNMIIQKLITNKRFQKLKPTKYKKKQVWVFIILFISFSWGVALFWKTYSILTLDLINASNYASLTK